MKTGKDRDRFRYLVSNSRTKELSNLHRVTIYTCTRICIVPAFFLFQLSIN